MSDKVQTKVYLPAELKALLDADNRSNSEAVEVALWREYGGEKQAAIERRIEEKKRRISMIESERNERERELRDEREELEKLQERQDTAQDARKEALNQMLNELDSLNASIPKDAGMVKDLAEQWFDGNTDTAWSALKEHNQQRDNSLPESTFLEGMGHE